MPSHTLQIINQQVALDTDYLKLSFSGDIEKTELYKLLRLKNLKHLNTACADLCDQHLEVIGQITTLELLDLDSTAITDNGLQHLIPLNQLKELRLKDNPQLTDACLDFLSNIEQLKLIHIGNTSITITGLATLLAKKELATIILDTTFDTARDELLKITKQYPQLSITLKGTGVIANGKLNE
ncbi:MAG: hypothetical protein ACFB0B_03845 [Thermonemataceae bacterium]